MVLSSLFPLTINIVLAVDLALMTDELIELTELFCEHGGRFENMTIGYRQESGYYCSVIDSNRNATLFCPAHLLVDVDDIGISETGLFITRPEKYTNNIRLLEKYFSIHFDERIVGELLEEKRQIDSLSEHEKLLLKRINLPAISDGTDEKLEYVKQRILQSHRLGFKLLESKVIMPFVTLLNHSQDGVPYYADNNGITVSGKFDGEVFVNYNMGDVLMFLEHYRFVTDTMFVYSLPMKLNFSDGITLQIDRNISKFKTIDGKFRWPVVERKDGLFTVSWFPMYCKNGPRYPTRFAASLSRESNIPAENILYSVFLCNLNALLAIVFALKDSKNSYVQMVISGVERQLELIGEIQK